MLINKAHFELLSYVCTSKQDDEVTVIYVACSHYHPIRFHIRIESLFVRMTVSFDGSVLGNNLPDFKQNLMRQVR